jgi:hypothetical protein
MNDLCALMTSNSFVSVNCHRTSAHSRPEASSVLSNMNESREKKIRDPVKLDEPGGGAHRSLSNDNFILFTLSHDDLLRALEEEEEAMLAYSSALIDHYISRVSCSVCLDVVSSSSCSSGSNRIECSMYGGEYSCSTVHLIRSIARLLEGDVSK